jgi:hypothetical protein
VYSATRPENFLSDRFEQPTNIKLLYVHNYMMQLIFFKTLKSVVWTVVAVIYRNKNIAETVEVGTD